PAGQAADPRPAGAGRPDRARAPGSEAVPPPLHAAGHDPSGILRGRPARRAEGQPQPVESVPDAAAGKGLTSLGAASYAEFRRSRPAVSLVPVVQEMTSNALADTEAAVPSPPTARKQTRVDVVHGDRREDDYFWMREKSNPEVASYLEAEN